MGFKSRGGRRDPAIDAWFVDRQHPQTALMKKVREVILGADPRVAECVKWSCPTFTFEGNIVSINAQAKKFVSLMFHTGGAIPGDLPQLTGTGATCKFMRFDDAADLEARRGELVEVVQAWCAWKA
jgi:hypothetical protein